LLRSSSLRSRDSFLSSLIPPWVLTRFGTSLFESHYSSCSAGTAANPLCLQSCDTMSSTVINTAMTSKPDEGWSKSSFCDFRNYLRRSVVIVARSARIAGSAELSLSYFHVTINPHFLLCRLLPRNLWDSLLECLSRVLLLTWCSAWYRFSSYSMFKGFPSNVRSESSILYGNFHDSALKSISASVFAATLVMRYHSLSEYLGVEGILIMVVEIEFLYSEVGSFKVSIKYLIMEVFRGGWGFRACRSYKVPNKRLCHETMIVELLIYSRIVGIRSSKQTIYLLIAFFPWHPTNTPRSWRSHMIWWLRV